MKYSITVTRYGIDREIYALTCANDSYEILDNGSNAIVLNDCRGLSGDFCHLFQDCYPLDEEEYEECKAEIIGNDTGVSSPINLCDIPSDSVQNYICAILLTLTTERA